MRVWMNDLQNHSPMMKWVEAVRKRKVKIWMSVTFLFCSFFLSQAVLFEAVVPFFLPIWALTVKRYPAYLPWTFAGGMAGSLMLGFGETAIHLLQLALFQFLFQSHFFKKYIPFTVLLTVLTVQTGWQIVSYSGQVPFFVWMFVTYEGILTLFMTLFLFLFFKPIHQFLHDRWTFERLAAAFIICAMILTGMDKMIVGYVSIPVAAIHLVILLSASIAGLPVATAVATIVGVIVSVSNLSFSGMIAVYTLTGLCAGLFHRWGKPGIAVGSVLSSLFFLMYDATLPIDVTFFISIATASVIYFLFPQSWIVFWKDQLFPNRVSTVFKRQEWLTDRINRQLSDFHQFVDFMSEVVSERFSPAKEDTEKLSFTEPLSICQACFRKEKCWGAKNNGMAETIDEWIIAKGSAKKALRHKADEKIAYKCVRSAGLISELEEEITGRLLTGQMHHGKKMLALQLRDMGRHLDHMITDIKEGMTSFKLEEEEISNKLNELNIHHFQVDVLSEEKGARKIIICLSEKKSEWETDHMLTERFILPALYDMYKEPFEITRSDFKKEPFPHQQISLSSAVRFKMDYAVLSSSKNGTLYAGDAHAVFPLHNGLTAVVLSDGMGQDINAYKESRKVIRLMRECLNRKMDPETAMHTLHYVMSLKDGNDLYATVDLGLLDLQEGQLWSYKAGSMSTYLKRGTEFSKIESESLPVGFLPSFTIEAKKKRLKSGDLIVMMTDGMFSPDVPIEKQENVLYNILQRADDWDTNRIAEAVMHEMTRKYKHVADDRTIIVIRIDHTVPEWSIFSPSSKHRVISRETMAQ